MHATSVKHADLEQPDHDEGLYGLSLLDGFRVRHGDTVLQLARSEQRLVAFLAMRRQPCERRQLAEALFGEHNHDRAAGNLRSTLYRLRTTAPDLLTVQRDRLQLHTGSTVDIRRLDLILDQLLHPSRAASATIPPIADLCGELLPGWDDDWVVVERERLRQRYLHALDLIGNGHLRAGDHSQAIDVAMTAVAIEPLRESPRRLLIEVHLAEGNLSEAVREYTEFDELLFTELGLHPTHQLTALLPRR